MNFMSSSTPQKSDIAQEHFHLAKEVLIVSTDEFSSLRLKLQIESCFHHCIGVVPHFIRAERMIESHRPDLVLISMDLSGEFDGFETAKVLNLEYDIPLVLYGSEKHREMDYWLKKIKASGVLYLNRSDEDLKKNLEGILS